MNDPLSEVIALLQPRAVFSKGISGAGRRGVRYPAFDQPSCCAVREGAYRLAVDGHRPLTLEAGDFVLLPSGSSSTRPTGAARRGAAVDPRRRRAANLLRGLADARIAPAIRQMHGQLTRSWTVPQLARAAGLSRSAFFEQSLRTVDAPPMDMLAWRMAVAKDLLRRHDLGIAEVAGRVGYRAASAFSTAFSRYVGEPPSRYAAGVPAPAGPRARSA